MSLLLFFVFNQKTAYELRISDWSSTCALPISNNMADEACHVVGSTTQVWLTQALGLQGQIIEQVQNPPRLRIHRKWTGLASGSGCALLRSIPVHSH